MFRNKKSYDKSKQVRENFEEDIWRKENKEYLESIEKFLDIVDNIADEDLKKRIIYEHFNCERILKKIFEK